MWNEVRRVKCVEPVSGLEVNVLELADMERHVPYAQHREAGWYCRQIKFETEAGQQCVGDHGVFRFVKSDGSIGQLLCIDEASATFHSNQKLLEMKVSWVTEETALATKLEAKHISETDHAGVQPVRRKDIAMSEKQDEHSAETHSYPLHGFIVMLEAGCWLADTEGDPGRTLQKKNAYVFDDRSDAVFALRMARVYRRFLTAEITEV